MSAVVETRKALAIAGAHLLAAIKPTDEEQDAAMERLKEGGWALDDEHAAWSADVAEAVLALREEGKGGGGRMTNEERREVRLARKGLGAEAIAAAV